MSSLPLTGRPFAVSTTSCGSATPMWASGVDQSWDQMTGIGSPDLRHFASVFSNAPGMIRSPPWSTLLKTATVAVNQPLVSVVGDLAKPKDLCLVAVVALAPSA